MTRRMLTVTALVTALFLPSLLALPGCFEEHRERRDMERHEDRHDEHHDEQQDEHHGNH